MVLPIKGPFKSSPFGIVSSAPLIEDRIIIQWKDEDSYWEPSKSDLRLRISYNSIRFCNSTTPLEIAGRHVFKDQDIWSFYITSEGVKILLNGKLAYSDRKRGINEECQIWKDDLETIEILTGPVEAFRTYDNDEG